MGNKERDKRHLATLESMGWRVMTIWDCELKNTAALARKIDTFMSK